MSDNNNNANYGKQNRNNNNNKNQELLGVTIHNIAPSIANFLEVSAQEKRMNVELLTELKGLFTLLKPMLASKIGELASAPSAVPTKEEPATHNYEVSYNYNAASKAHCYTVRRDWKNHYLFYRKDEILNIPSDLAMDKELCLLLLNEAMEAKDIETIWLLKDAYPQFIN